MKSDVDKGQSRFSIPQRRILNEFLTEEEHKTLHKQNMSIPVKLIQPCRETCEVVLRKWDFPKSFSYVLVRTWNNVVKDPRNGLKEKVEVQLWSYHINGSLIFAMTRVNERGGEGQE
ncbi:hypothetical protein MLD38_030296 [Melastoma candidum]|uniref:Uncharacterized protein n=1 Tax=Melastoma candidum TaxID=119954 RepID=A0ACB9MN36_9MYRT|nr:hypothetical protein MLD38_030296 [Melastoma candidum]